jgi:hypothetical protein
MPNLTPEFLLSSPTLVIREAPWCTAADNLELGVLLLSQPWVAGGGLRRADLERQLGSLSADMPLGPVYFQRVSRAVARMERIGALRGTGRGRARRFAVTPRGFATLILNLRVLQADPTLDGGEFEFKRALVAMWNLTLERLLELGDQLEIDPAAKGFFGEVESLRVLGAPVITEKLLRSALDVLGLIDLQRTRVRELLAEAEERLGRTADRARALRRVEITRGAGRSRLSPRPPVKDDAALAALVRGLVTGALPDLTLRTTTLRYRKYLEYLDRLERIHARELKVVDLGSLRRLGARRRA